MSQGQYFFYDLDTLYIILSMSPDNLKGYKIKKFNDKDQNIFHKMMALRLKKKVQFNMGHFISRAYIKFKV